MSAASDTGRLEQARRLYERAVFLGDQAALDVAERTLDGVEADLDLARGRIVHARFLASREEDASELPLFTRAQELYSRLGDVRGEGEALLWVGLYHQVVQEDSPASVPFLERARECALASGDAMTLSYVVRHLGFADAHAGKLETAQDLLEESVRLRRELGFMPGVAAGLLALAEFAFRTGRSGDAVTLLDEATAVAQACGANGTMAWIDGLRSRISPA